MDYKKFGKQTKEKVLTAISHAHLLGYKIIVKNYEPYDREDGSPAIHYLSDGEILDFITTLLVFKDYKEYHLPCRYSKDGGCQDVAILDGDNELVLLYRDDNECRIYADDIDAFIEDTKADVRYASNNLKTESCQVRITFSK